MKPINEVIHQLIRLRESGRKQATLLAVCPNSEAVLEAAVKAAARNNAPMLFAATLNQVDRDGGYTGWTAQAFVQQMRSYAEKYCWEGPLYPCLDHGGPWLKDLHTLQRLSYEETMQEVKHSLTACLEAGYSLLHIDPTVDRTLPHGEPLPVATVVARTVEMIEHAERERKMRGLPPISYEVGTEEVHGGLVNLDSFRAFLTLLRDGLEEKGLMDAWPAFVVAQVGTDLHTTFFDPLAAARLYDILAPSGSLAKGHYSDWVENPEEYPARGMGGANVGPEFTSEELLALRELAKKEAAMCENRPGLSESGFLTALEEAVIASGRWKKWLQPGESDEDFHALRPERQDWLLQTGARYIWTQPSVKEARARLYENLSLVMPNPHGYVVDRIASAIDHYINAFNLFDFLSI